MTEQVIRHRGGGRDENGAVVPSEPDKKLRTIAVAPGTGSQFAERARDGESTAYTVYLPIGTDIVNSDELTVRGDRFSIIVNDWRLQNRGGMEVLCTRSQG